MAIGGTKNTGGFKLINSLPITAALTDAVQRTITGLDGMTAVTVVASMVGGTDGTAILAKVQTSLDGIAWYDIAQLDFANTAATFYANVSGLLVKAPTAYVPLAAAGVNDGFLGSLLRGIVTSTGTYSGTTLSLLASVR
jgi:hypothetical protein